MKHLKINSQEELDNLIQSNEGDPLEIFISFGYARSSKSISIDENNDYCIFHEIDDTDEVLPHSRLMDSNIGKALSNGNLYKYNYD